VGYLDALGLHGRLGLLVGLVSCHDYPCVVLREAP
jgi:hypothetical protein